MKSIKKEIERVQNLLQDSAERQEHDKVIEYASYIKGLQRAIRFLEEA